MINRYSEQFFKIQLKWAADAFDVERRPLPRTDRWYLYIARPRTSRLPSWFERHVRQTSMLRRFTDRLPMKTRSDSSRKTGD